MPITDAGKALPINRINGGACLPGGNMRNEIIRVKIVVKATIATVITICNSVNSHTSPLICHVTHSQHRYHRDEHKCLFTKQDKHH